MAKVFVITGPSGVGKGTLIRTLLQRVPELELSVSATTRRPRPGETEGVAYHFLSEDEFERRVRAGDFVEHARYSGRRYGTLRSELDARIAGGRPMVLEIEVQGARQIREAMPEAVQIFIAPPSEEALRTRLVGRGTDDPEQIAARLATAHEELEARGEFAHVVVNDRLDDASDALEACVREHLARPCPTGGLTADHGSGLSPADEALLRGPPPARAIAWCERVAGARVIGGRAAARRDVVRGPRRHARRRARAGPAPLRARGLAGRGARRPRARGRRAADRGALRGADAAARGRRPGRAPRPATRRS